MKSHIESSPETVSGSPLQLITPKLVGWVLFLGLCAILATGLLMLEFKWQVAMLLAVPAIVIGVWVLVNPWVGVFLFYLYSFLRPYDFIPALRPLRLAMVLEIVTLLSVIIYFIRTRRPLVWHKLNWYYVTFVGIIAATVPLAANNFYAYRVFEAMGIAFLMHVLATNMTDSQKKLNLMIWMLMFIHLYFGIKGIMNYRGGYTSMGQNTTGSVGSGFIGDENDFAMAICVFIPFAFFMFTHFKDRLRRLLSLMFLGVFVIAVIMSMSRGGWVGLVVVLLYCIFNAKRKLMAFTYAVALAVLMAVAAPAKYWNEIRTISDTKEQTADIRLRSWAAGFHMYLDHPILGVGAANSGIYLPYYIQGTTESGRMWGRALHGTVPMLFAELGTFGVICWFGLLVAACRLLWRIGRSQLEDSEADEQSYMARSLLGGILGYFACATFLSTLYYPQLWMLVTLTVMLALIRKQTEQRLAKEQPRVATVPAPVAP